MSQPSAHLILRAATWDWLHLTDGKAKVEVCYIASPRLAADTWGCRDSDPVFLYPSTQLTRCLYSLDWEVLGGESVRHSVMADFSTPWTVMCQAPLSMELSRQEYWRADTNHRESRYSKRCMFISKQILVSQTQDTPNALMGKVLSGQAKHDWL